MILKGNPVSPGMALGKVFLYKPFSYTKKEAYFEVGEEAKYIKIFDSATKTANDELDSILDSIGNDSDEKSKIIKTHKELLVDEEIIEMAHESISNERKMPDFAVCEVFAEFMGILSKVKDPIIAGRVSDLKDVRDRILRILVGEPERSLSKLPGNVIIVTHDLLPSATANLDNENVMAIVAEVGGMTSHSAIIARSCGIPAVLGAVGATNALLDGEDVAVNALEGFVANGLTDAEKTQFNTEKAAYKIKTFETAKFLNAEPVMADGTRIEIGVNIGSDKYVDGYLHCDYIGLFRTEFLYMENNHLPDEEDQLRAYKKVVENAGEKPVIIRTLDIGGDKTLDYLELPKELNPFLGKRALRLCLDRRDIFKTQLRAILRSSFYGDIWVMFPMVGSMDDIYNAKGVLDEAKNELASENKAYNKNIKVGVMIEIPSAAIIADMIAKEVDFASIGTNDLCQYLTAVDRTNGEISHYYQSMAPAVIRTIKLIADAFIVSGKPLSVCGELAGNPKAAVVLTGLGIKKLSMSPSNLANVKECLSRVTAEKAVEIACNILNMRTQSEILDYLSCTI
jgi:phosphotransferase system enzyme I (PtsI)